MLCPVCSQPMLIVEFEQIELDTCGVCGGIWFDAQELGQLFELAGGSERFCVMLSQVERLPHAGPRRKCPRCGRRLRPVRAPAADGKLILDECPRDDGLWFDRGELESLLRCALTEDASALEHVRQHLGRFLSWEAPGPTANA